jgi:hypothetical protein
MQMLKSAAKKQPNEDDEDVKEFDAESWPFKDADLARQNREDGNAAFQSGSYELALLLYTEAMRYGPVHPSTLEGEDFAAAAANRSAALFQLEKYQECLQELCCQMTLSFAFLVFFFLEAFCNISHRLGGITPFSVFSDAFPGIKMWVTFACATAIF